MRILSLLPSATEIVCALGAGPELVGRSEECDFPKEVRDLPVVMRARTLDADRPSGEIDARVSESLRSGESLYTLDLERLSGLRPDLLITQDLCQVCSVTDSEVRAACGRAGVSPRILSISPRRLEEVRRSVTEIGRATGRPEAADRLSEELRAREERAVPPDGAAGRPRVAVLEWVDPPILAGLWTPELVDLAGGHPIGPPPGSPSARTDWERLHREDPDLVLVSPCSFPIERTRRELAGGAVSDGLARLSPRFGTWIADEAYFSRPGPRLWESLRLLRHVQLGERPPPGMPFERWVPASEAT